VRTIEVESWLRSLPLARSSCAKIRNLMSVLFNHAWRHELFDRNPIKLVRQSAKRRTAPNVLAPAEIKLLLDHLVFENELWFWWQPQPACAKVSYLRSNGATSIFPRAP
jgi:site-specific recombinase XerD